MYTAERQRRGQHVFLPNPSCGDYFLLADLNRIVVPTTTKNVVA